MKDLGKSLGVFLCAYAVAHFLASGLADAFNAINQAESNVDKVGEDCIAIRYASGRIYYVCKGIELFCEHDALLCSIDRPDGAASGMVTRKSAVSIMRSALFGDSI